MQLSVKISITSYIYIRHPIFRNIEQRQFFFSLPKLKVHIQVKFSFQLMTRFSLKDLSFCILALFQHPDDYQIKLINSTIISHALSHARTFMRIFFKGIPIAIIMNFEPLLSPSTFLWVRSLNTHPTQFCFLIGAYYCLFYYSLFCF